MVAGIRLAPLVVAGMSAGGGASGYLAFAVAVMLRFLTPHGPQPRAAAGVFTGRMDPAPLPPGEARGKGRGQPLRKGRGEVSRLADRFPSTSEDLTAVS
jgi:hypothetical protein